ncbi:xanthine dehydrogenase family protein molybdopterin-binding subunit [Streptomyces boncukensis]|uniref:Xanthine dehydrogenase family protein n=1 Tax=Streptomyces boncukensis TaxID=2711219 RepID=A0A6G4X6X4_9ACTN|nr:xanthine dehydrogenase family protein molybdopterin-binding subunit [Streptomyces boncukensis]NGO72421.1 xanthine dehydrogenase family protein [Streptomyces boncukensis]
MTEDTGATGPGPLGRALPRTHDPRLLRGDGRYVDDIAGPQRGVLHAAVLRSPVAHGRVTRFDATAAREDSGAHLVLGPDGIARHTGPLPTFWRLPGQWQHTIEVATRTVRYVGQPIGLVVADSRAAAEDAAERVEVSIDPLPAVTDVDAALAPRAPLLYPETGTNAAGRIRLGDPEADVERAMADAAHLVTRELAVQRVSVAPMEPRGLLAEWTPATQQLTVCSSTQVPHPVRCGLAAALRLRADQVRVTVPDVGGGFGGKTTLYVDETLVCLAAKLLGGRVAWTEDRAEAMAADYHGRGQRATARLALDADGRFLALDARVRGDLGAFATQGGSGPFQITGLSLEGPYRFPCAGATVTGVYTNATPTGAYRGYGMQEACWIRERLIAEAARELGLDPGELRLRNLITVGEMPYTVRAQTTYDTGDYPATLQRAMAAVAERPRVRTGRLRRGVAAVPSVEGTGYGPTALLEQIGLEASGWESGRIRINEDGTVTVFTGAVSLGQGIETALAQIVADRLGLPLERIAVRLGDTDTSPHSDYSSQASRSLVLCGTALLRAGERLRARMDALAAALLETVPEDVRLEADETFRGEKTSRTATWREVAARGWLGWGRPEHDRIRLEESVDYDPPDITFAHAAHAAAVAVDLDTGVVTVEGYWAVHDSGVLVNPLIAEGQTVGEGLGMALLEEADCDPATAQPLRRGLADYPLPAPADVPPVEVAHTRTPSPHNEGGFKGLGEGGILPVAAVVAGAVADAVPEIAAGLNRTPLTPYRIWTLLREAGLA